MMQINHEMLRLARTMVEIPSVNSTDGERRIGEFIETYFREIPYFRERPDQVIVQELKDDVLHRRNVFAILLGEKEGHTGDTLIFHGHTDTVGLEGYGAAADVACQPEALSARLRQMQLPEEVREDLESGEYMFGRGACDMKSGDAVFMELFREMSAHPEELAGNIIVSFNPVEENLHTGIMEGLEILEAWKEKYHLHYLMAINNDYICPLYPGDTVKTIYTGVVGKILPCFYIQGKETHVGQCFEGMDASMVAAELLNRIHMKREFADEYEGEYTYPPSVLKIKDLKPWYNVQTASEAFLYFNYFVHNATMEEITEKLKQAAVGAFESVVGRINEESEWFCSVSGQQYRPYRFDTLVYTYEELYQLADHRGGVDGKELEAILKRQIEAGTDKREAPIAMIRYLLQKASITAPAVILYYAAPYCPHNTLLDVEEKFLDDLRAIAAQTAEETGDSYRFMKFFPSLSDSSFLKIDDHEESIAMLSHNFPGFAQLYPMPLERIRRLHIPTVNYGCYGKDAHKWTERVNIPYTFGHLPVLIRNTVAYYLGGKA